MKNLSFQKTCQVLAQSPQAQEYVLIYRYALSAQKDSLNSSQHTIQDSFMIACSQKLMYLSFSFLIQLASMDDKKHWQILSKHLAKVYYRTLLLSIFSVLVILKTRQLKPFKIQFCFKACAAGLINTNMRGQSLRQFVVPYICSHKLKHLTKAHGDR